jgi:hypothetical protein
MLTATKLPPYLSLSGNPVMFTIASTNVVTDHYIGFQIYFQQAGGNTWPMIAEDQLPVINGQVSFDISDYLKEEISRRFNFPHAANYTDFEMSFAGLYAITYYQLYNKTGVKYDSDSTSSYRVIQGRISRKLNDRLASFGKTFYQEFIVINKKFLSFSPIERIVTKTESVYLHFFSGANRNASKKCKIYYDDTTTETITLGEIIMTKGKTYEIGASYDALNLVTKDVTKKIIYYDVWLADSFGSVSETKRYFLDYGYKNYRRQFIFRNSLGVYEAIEFHGVGDSENEYSFDVVIQDEFEKVSLKERSELFTASTGWLNEATKNWVMHIFDSAEVYETIGTEIFPIIITSKKAFKNRDNQFLHNVEIEYKRVETDNYEVIESLAGDFNNDFNNDFLI